MRKLSILLVGLTLMVSCTERKHNADVPAYADDVEQLSLRGDTILSETLMGNPGQIWCAGDTIILSDMMDGFVYSALSVSGDSLITRFGSIGEGPGQLLRPGNLQLSSHGDVWIYDDVRSSLNAYSSLSGLLDVNDSVPSIRFDDMTGGYLNVTENGYVGDQLYGDGKMLAYYSRDGKRSTFGVVPGTDESGSVAPDFYMAYQVQFVTSPDGKYVCAAGAYHDWLAFFDVSGDMPRLIKEYYTEAPVVEASGSGDKFRLHLTPETKFHYWSAAPFDGGVYLNYVGADESKLGKGDISTTILRCNWKGEIEKAYNLDYKVGSICSKGAGDILYALTFQDVYPETKVLKYKIER